MTTAVLVEPVGRSMRRSVGPAVGRMAAPLVTAVVVLALWEALVAVFEVEAFLLPRPSAIVQALVDELSVILDSAWFTLRSVLGGLALGVALGVALALVAARFRAATDAALPIAIAVNATPIVALAPVTNAWFGITSPVSKIAVVAVLVFFPVLVNTLRGLTSVDRGQLELLRSLAASGRQVAFVARIPTALPFLFSALKVSASLSVIAAIVSEYFGGPRQALGVYISQRASLTRFDEVWAAIVVASAIGLTLYALVVALERVCTPWQRPQHHPEQGD